MSFVALVGVVVLVATAGTSHSPQARAHLPDAARGLGGAGIANYCGGEATTLDGIQAKAPYEVGIPDSSIASRSNVSVVYWCPDADQQVAVMFTNGVILDITPSQFADPAGAWKRIVDAYPDAGYSLGSINGQPALLGDIGGPFESKGVVEWDDQGVQFTLTGNQVIPLADLVEAARSVPVPKSSAGR
jgi:hypothetical protein